MKQKSSKITYDLLINGIKTKKDLLVLFSLYIASNPDFKYNTTYLTDTIDKFITDKKIFYHKISVYKQIIDYLADKSEHNIIVIFDSIFKYNTHDTSDLKFVSENNNFQFNKMGNKSFTIKFIFQSKKSIEYQYKIENYDNEDDWKTISDSFISIISKKYD